MIVSRSAQEEIDFLKTRVKEMEAALQECAEYFDQRAEIRMRERCLLRRSLGGGGMDDF